MADELMNGYSGVDNDPDERKGAFDNEIEDEEVEKKKQEQDRQTKELTPKLEGIIKMLDSEIQGAYSVKPFVDAISRPEGQVAAELQSIARYVVFIEALKNKFSVVLRETKKVKDESMEKRKKRR